MRTRRLETYAEEMAKAAAAQDANAEPTGDETLRKAANRRPAAPRFVLGRELELSGTSFFPERMNDKGKIVPAVYSGWHEDELFRLLGPDAVELNKLAPAWFENRVKHPERGGQIVVLGTKPGKSCRYQEPGEEDDFISSFSLNAGHLTGEVEVIGAEPVKFHRKAS